MTWANKQQGSSGTDASTYNFAITLPGIVTKAAAAVHWRRGATTSISSVKITNIDGAGTVGEITMQRLRGIIFDPAGSCSEVAIYEAALTGGSTADLQLNTAATVLRAAFQFDTNPDIDLLGAEDVANVTAETSNSNPLSVTVNVEIGGGLMAAATNNTQPTTAVWVGATEEATINVESQSWFGSALLDVAATEANRTISATLTSAGIADHCMAVVAWPPTAAAAGNPWYSYAQQRVRTFIQGWRPPLWMPGRPKLIVPKGGLIHA